MYIFFFSARSHNFILQRMGTLKIQSVTCYVVPTACDNIKSFDINIIDVCSIHIFIELQPTSKNRQSQVLIMAFNCNAFDRVL